MTPRAILVHGCVEGVGDRDVPCNALCKHPIHCDLAYSPAEQTAAGFRAQWEIDYLSAPVRFVDVRPAPEAPPIPPPGYYGRSLLAAIPSSERHHARRAWLLRWQFTGEREWQPQP